MDITRKGRIAGAVVGLALAGLFAGLYISGLTAHIELPFRDRWMEIRMAETELLANGVATLLAGTAPREVPAAVIVLTFLFLGAVLLPVFGMIDIARAVALLVLVEIATLFGFHELALRDLFVPPLTTGLLVLCCFFAALPIRSLRVAESIRAHVLHAPLVPHEGASIALVEGGQRLWGEVALESRRLLDFDALGFIVRSLRADGLGLVRSEGMEPTRIRPGAWGMNKPPFREAAGADGPVECPPLFDDPEVASYLCPFAYRGVVLGFLALGTKRGPAHMEGRAAIVKQISIAVASELRRREGRKHLEGKGILYLSGQSEKTVLDQVAGLEETLRVAQNEREIIDAALKHADGGVFVSDVFGRVTRMSPGIESILSPVRQSLGWGIDDLPEIVALLTGQGRERSVLAVNEILGSGESLVLDAALPPGRTLRIDLKLEPVLRKAMEGEGARPPGQVLAIVGSLRRPAEEMASLSRLGEIRALLAGELLGHVGAIQGFAEILARSGGLTGATREYLAALQANVKDMDAAVRRALAPSPPEPVKPAAAAEICQEMVETLEPDPRPR